MEVSVPVVNFDADVQEMLSLMANIFELTPHANNVERKAELEVCTLAFASSLHKLETKLKSLPGADRELKDQELELSRLAKLTQDADHILEKVYSLREKIQ